ncbi:hypothetical protein [Rugamonas violacea]|uniref:hypothetical protein n=1 Tax=Rugamonas sp. CCM 8940 TaxID=2765359 RepID=UPI0018F46E93|nr:hypothetical protein [Rugamonas sp. CCM 8940]
MKFPFLFFIIFPFAFSSNAQKIGSAPVVSVDTSGLGTSNLATVLAKSAGATTEELTRRLVASLIHGNAIDEMHDKKQSMEALGFNCSATLCNYKGIYRSVVRSEKWLQYADRNYDISVDIKKSPIEIKVSIQSIRKESSELIGTEIGEFIAKEGPFSDNEKFSEKVMSILSIIPKQDRLEELRKMGFICENTCEFSGGQRIDVLSGWDLKSRAYKYNVTISDLSGRFIVNANQFILN